MHALQVYDETCINIKIRIYDHRVYTNFRGLYLLENGVKCKYFTVISIDSLLVYENKYYLQVYLDYCAYKIVDTEMVDYLDNSFFIVS